MWPQGAELVRVAAERQDGEAQPPLSRGTTHEHAPAPCLADADLRLAASGLPDHARYCRHEAGRNLPAEAGRRARAVHRLGRLVDQPPLWDVPECLG
ncbi:hypothetical protein G6F24_016450 [Rhizopus arrhizus]|nr:hypothetical protein G6F24_016450 [Rhizopus arrhizus]